MDPDQYYDKELNGVRYHLLEGIRTDEVFKPSCCTNLRWVHYWANIFVDCTMCSQSIGMKLRDGTVESREVEMITDEMATSIFYNRGWDIDLHSVPKKILCPTCKNIPVEEML
jgi:hypothetical protein